MQVTGGVGRTGDGSCAPLCGVARSRVVVAARDREGVVESARWRLFGRTNWVTSRWQKVELGTGTDTGTVYLYHDTRS